MNIPSYWWLACILLGVVLVALGNIMYASARDHERGVAASEKASQLLSFEMQRNLDRIVGLRANLQQSQVSSISLETTAWDIVSKSGLLTNLEPDRVNTLAGIYYLISQAESYRTEVITLSVGVASALGSSAATKSLYLKYLNETIDKLEPALRAELERVNKSR
jgi:hypothetical protein